MLAPASEKLAQATPPLARSIGVLNTLFNTLAYQPEGASRAICSGARGSATSPACSTSQQDAQGPIVRGTFMASCSELQLFEVTLPRATPSIGQLLALLNAPD